jgi:AcrR family transcriptional regulator
MEARRPRGRPRSDESPASSEDVFAAALTAFATHGYDGVSLRTLNRQLGVSHNFIAARFGSKETLWYATVDWAYAPLANKLASAFDPTVSDPLEQLRLVIRMFLVHSAEHPELLGLMNIEARQDTERLAYIYSSYIEPTLAPVARLLDHLVAEGRARPIPLRTFHFLLTHGGAAPFSLVPLARHFDRDDPLDAAAVREHADLVADALVRVLEPADARATPAD